MHTQQEKRNPLKGLSSQTFLQLNPTHKHLSREPLLGHAPVNEILFLPCDVKIWNETKVVMTAITLKCTASIAENRLKIEAFCIITRGISLKRQQWDQRQSLCYMCLRKQRKTEQNDEAFCTFNVQQTLRPCFFPIFSIFSVLCHKIRLTECSHHNLWIFIAAMKLKQRFCGPDRRRIIKPRLKSCFNIHLSIGNSLHKLI